nr:reverse transcriptase domain-containing protein [Tanacetum cinerariifolium]
MTKYYNSRVRGVAFQPGDFVYRSNDASHAAAGGKLGPKWEGPYEVTDALGNGAYKLRSMDGKMQDVRAQFSDLKVSNEHLSQRVAALQEQRCAELDARLDALSIDFDEELYPHMLTAIAGRRWIIGHGLRLTMMKCAESLEMRQAFADVVSAGVAKGMSEGLKHVVEHGQAQLKLESIEAYDPEAEAKFVTALQSLKDLEFSLLDELESLKDTPMDELDFPQPFRKGACYVDSPFIERPQSRNWGQRLLGMSCDGTVYLTVAALAYHVLIPSINSYWRALRRIFRASFSSSGR